MKKIILTIGLIVFTFFVFGAEIDPCNKAFQVTFARLTDEYEEDVEYCDGNSMCLDEAVLAYNQGIVDALKKLKDCLEG